MFILADIEATCWERHKKVDDNEIIEIAFLVCNVKGDVLCRYQSFAKPVTNTKLSRFCKKLTGIKQEDLVDARPLGDVILEITDMIEDRFGIPSHFISWASWGNWDPICLGNDCERHNVDVPFGNHINLQKLYEDLRGVNVGLKEACELEGYKWIGERHRALSDTENSLNIAKILL